MSLVDTTPELLARRARRTLYHHLHASAGMGLAAGVGILGEYIARKGLGASRVHILVLLALPPIAQFFASIWNPTDPRRLLGRRPFLFLGVPSRLLLLLPLAFVTLREATPFVSLAAFAVAAEFLLIPTQNALLATGYEGTDRGRRFGLSMAVTGATIVLVSYPAGRALDRAPDLWPWLLAFSAAAGLYGYFHWSKLRAYLRPPVRSDEPRPVALSPWRTLLSRPRFLRFEAAFMAYGLGFLALQPVLPLYLVDELNITYTQIGTARGLFFWISFFVSSFFFGRWVDRIGVTRGCAAAFLVLALFPLVLLLGGGTGVLYPAFTIYGVAMGAIAVIWNLGPIAMAGDEDPLPFLNAHLALVGLRAMVGMIGGSALQAATSSQHVFGLVVVFQIVAAVMMFRIDLEKPGDSDSVRLLRTEELA